MPNDLYGVLPQLAFDALPISLVAWIGLWFLVRSAGFSKEVPALGGPFTFLLVWALVIFANYNTQGQASSGIEALAFSVLAIGCLVWIIAVVARAFTNLSRRRRGPRNKWGHA